MESSKSLFSTAFFQQVYDPNAKNKFAVQAQSKTLNALNLQTKTYIIANSNLLSTLLSIPQDCGILIFSDFGVICIHLY